MHRLEIERQEIMVLVEDIATGKRDIYSDLIARYAIMKMRGMTPVNYKLHPEKHFAHDHACNWPLASGTSLNSMQYAAVEEILSRCNLDHLRAK